MPTGPAAQPVLEAPNHGLKFWPAPRFQAGDASQLQHEPSGIVQYPSGKGGQITAIKQHAVSYIVIIPPCRVYPE